ncbi:solute carrier family 52, riboflavin transporter, member 3-like [Sycon ciliatum]|uniref:solute carrier family 52, riboflavin transporter, member 3-like n=1 Tax=Sycon ciliatum TaxID=27933 RepID=UPI0031F64E3E
MDGARTSWVTFSLVIVFGMGSWVAINGLWSELFVLIPYTAEQYKLTAYLTVIIQLANIGPIAYTIAERCTSEENRLRCQSFGVAAVVSVGTLACVLLSQLWHRCSMVGGTEHSTALLALSFFLALVDCTSSVVFLPVLAHLPAVYMSALYIGEGFSGLVPSALALIQHTSDADSCAKQHWNASFPGCSNSTGVSVEGVRFQPSSYFGALAATTIACGVAFTLLRYRMGVYQRLPDGNSDGEQVSSSSTQSNTDGTQFFELSCSYARHLGFDQEVLARGGSPKTLVLMLLAIAWTCALSNGVVPAISSYAYLPYGRQAFLLTTVAGILTAPLASFLYFWLPSESKALLGGLVSVLTGIAGYILFLAIDCDRPLTCQSGGTALLVILVVIFSACVSYTKVLISTVARKMAHSRGLLWVGILTQVGSFTGAIITFALTEKDVFAEGSCT